jgi:DNA polymerase-3 subunit gamma/tau
LSLLEQVAALGGGTVSASGVERALGLADRDSFRGLVDAIVAEDAAAALTLVSELARQGADLRRFVADAIGYFRGIFLSQYASNVDEVVDASRETIDEWRQAAALISSSEVLRAIDELSDALLQLRDGREERLVVELAALRLAKPEVVPDLESVSARVARLEREVRDLGRARPAVPTPQPPPRVTAEDDAAPLDTDRPFTTDKPATERTAARPEPAAAEPAAAGYQPTAWTGAATAAADEGGADAGTFTIKDFERIWPAVVATIRQDVGPRRHALLREAVPVLVERGTVTFEVASHMHFHLEQLKADDGLAAAMAAAAADQLGQPVRIAYRSAVDAPADREPERAPSKDELAEPDEASEPDPTDTVLEILGGEVVSDPAGS